MAELAADSRFVAVKESSDDIRRSTEIINAFGDRFDLLTGVDNLAYEALSVSARSAGWRGSSPPFPRETVAIYQLMQQGRRDEALAIYRWFRPLLDLDVSTYLVQNIKFVEGACHRVQRAGARAATATCGRKRGRRRRKSIRDAHGDVRPEMPAF
jgi:dihydrodipicolinate synthase/N-acetylneuraminate lyase